jgi:hypothetical protein
MPHDAAASTARSCSRASVGAETTMTNDRMALLELVEKAADADLVREMLAFAAERIMDAEVETPTGASKGWTCPGKVESTN